MSIMNDYTDGMLLIIWMMSQAIHVQIWKRIIKPNIFGVGSGNAFNFLLE